MGCYMVFIGKVCWNHSSYQSKGFYFGEKEQTNPKVPSNQDGKHTNRAIVSITNSQLDFFAFNVAHEFLNFLCFVNSSGNFVVAKGLKEDVLKGFKIGAEDYLTKPFDSDILLEKIKVIMNRHAANGDIVQLPEEISIGNYRFLPNKRKLYYLQEEIQKLSPKESQLLLELLLQKNTVLKRSEALLKIWGEDNYFTTRSMDVYIAKLRKYLSKDNSITIENIHGNGFQLKEEQ